MRDRVLLLTGDGVGRGDGRLGQVILANLLRVVGGRDDLPAAVICMNGAVHLVCDGAEAFEAQEHLRELAAKGVPVYACKSCLEHFGLIERVVVGQIGGMPMFVELMSGHQVVTL